MQNADGSFGEFVWLTFAEVAARSRKIASALLRLLGSQKKETRSPIIGIAAPNVVDYFLVDFACMWTGGIA